MTTAEAVELSGLCEGKQFITQHIDNKIDEQLCNHSTCAFRLKFIWFLLHWLYLETLGRCLQPAKYHLFCLAKKEVEKKLSQY